MKIHLDTDFGGDIDDICALALLLRWRGGVEITGVTTVAEIEGKRAGQVRRVLELEGRADVPVAAGADVSGGFYAYELGLPPEERYWNDPVPPLRNSTDEALRLLKHGIEQGATIIGIGPYTNLYLLELEHPGILREAKIFLMGGFVYPLRAGFPDWKNEFDFNKQIDVRSAQYVFERCAPVLVPISVTAETFFRRAYINVLEGSGALGKLLAKQARAFAEDEKYEEIYGKTCPRLPADTINFQHDPLTAAIALGWSDGVEISQIPLKSEVRNGTLYQAIDPNGKPTRVVTGIDGKRFSEFWLETVAGTGNEIKRNM